MHSMISESGYITETGPCTKDMDQTDQVILSPESLPDITVSEVSGGQFVEVDINDTENGIHRSPSTQSHHLKRLRSHMTKEPIFDPFTVQNIIVCIFSAFLYLLDYGSDILVAISLKKDDINDVEDTEWWFKLTLIFIIGPTIIVNLFSIVWFHQDHQLVRGGIFPRRQKIKTSERIFLIFSHLLCLGPVIREGYIIRTGLKEKKQQKLEHSHKNIQGPYCINHNIFKKDKSIVDFYSLRKYYERDTAYLGLIDSFIQDAPQLVLQIYILSVRATEIHSDTSTAVFQIVSVLTSLLSLSWAMVAYESANRWANPEKPNVSHIGNFVQFCWRFFMVASRVLALASFATVFPVMLFALGGGHWILMTLWIIMMGTNFCGSAEGSRRPIAEFIYDVVIGWVFIFDFIHVKEGPTRIKQSVYYIINLLEMAAILTVWQLQIDQEDFGSFIHEDWYHIMLLSLVPGFFLVGLSFMTLFYCCHHPGGRMPDKSQRASLF